MKLTLSAAAALALLFVIGACTGVPAPENTDWCYFHDFTQYPYEVEGLGEYVESVGWQTVEIEGDNILNIDLPNPVTVQAAYVEIVAERAPGVTGELTIEAADISAWGIVQYVENLYIPAIITQGQTFALSPQFPDSADDNLSIDLYVSQPVAITGVVTRGYGANPFPDNNCIEPTLPPTVTTPPSIGTETPTGTATITLTPSATAIPSWCYEWDLTATDGGFTAPDALSTWASGTGWQGLYRDGNSVESLYITKAFSATVIIGVEITYTKTAGQNANNVNILQIRNGATPVLSSTTNQIGTNLVKGASGNATGNLVYLDINSGTLGATITVSRLKLWGTGTSPFGDNCSPTATPTFTASSTFTASPTGSATRTPTPIYTSTRTPSPTVTNTRTRIPITIPPSSTLPATNTGTATGTIPPSSTAVPPTDTRTAIPTSTRFPTSTGTPTPNPSVTPDPGDELQDSVDYTNDLLEGITDMITSIFTEISDFFNWVFNSFGLVVDWIGSFFGWLGGTFTNLLSMLGNLLGAIWAFIGFIFGIIGALIQIVGMIISIIINALFLLFSWILQIIQLGNEVITAWITASPTPIPGFPLCKTAPRSSDICAIWYVARHTLFAGTLGQLIILVTTAIIDLGILFWIIKAIRAFIRRGEGITKS